MEEKTNK